MARKAKPDTPKPTRNTKETKETRDCATYWGHDWQRHYGSTVPYCRKCGLLS